MLQLQFSLNVGPLLALGKDIIGIAETGSGKTLASLCQLMHIKDRIKTDAAMGKKRKGPIHLIIPRQENLHMQSQVVLEEALTLSRFKVCACTVV